MSCVSKDMLSQSVTLNWNKMLWYKYQVWLMYLKVDKNTPQNEEYFNTNSMDFT